MRKSVLVFLTFCLIIIIALFGSDFYERLFTPHRAEKARNIQKIEEVMDYVSRYYVDDIEWDSATQKAVEAFLNQLDPHSVYINSRDAQINAENFEGKYQGIGIYYDVIDDYLTVISPIPDSPSDKVGLMAGDKIIEIDGESAIGISNMDVQKKLKGPKGTEVRIKVLREGFSEALEFSIIRDEIPIITVSTYFMADDSTGYIFLSRFAKTTEEEIENALADLENLGMKQLLLDLRWNAGGYLDQAVKVAAKFLAGHKRVVFTQGRLSRFDAEYFADDYTTTSVRDYPLVVLINHASASASEIVAGAIQDYDRGYIVGTSSFGKGLVQQEFPLVDDSRLRLTISKYYTPSGRLIQRPYKGKEIDEYYFDVTEVNDTLFADTTSRSVYFTASGREVYGGGGIKPDSTIEFQSLIKSQQLIQRLQEKRLLFEAAARYVASHRIDEEEFSDFLTHFEPPETLTSSLLSIAKEKGIEVDAADLRQNIQYIKHRLKAEIARSVWGIDKYYRILLENDNQYKAALTLFPQAKKIMLRPQKMTLTN